MWMESVWVKILKLMLKRKLEKSRLNNVPQKTKEKVPDNNGHIRSYITICDRA